MRSAILILAVVFTAVAVSGQWEARLDSEVRAYQTTDLGVILAGTEKSLYGIDGQTGERLWRLPTGRLEETSITPLPGTDLVLVSRDLGSRTRIYAVDVLTGGHIWQSEKMRGDVMQLAFDPERDLLAVITIRNNRGQYGKEFKRKPIAHMLRLSSGDELWKRSFDTDIEMMPTRFGEGLGEVSFTLDNYRAPLLLDGRLFLFYDGVTSYDAADGKEKEREKFRMNESGLALTEADPVFDERFVYISGRGRVRAVDRKTGQVVWKADDLGTASEMMVDGNTLFVRTGGRFTRLKDGDLQSKGPFGVSAIDVETGKTRWRFKGADKGLTNFVFPDRSTVMVADSDDIHLLDLMTGERKRKTDHNVDDARFLILNENRQAVVGGKDEIAAFTAAGVEAWRVRHKAPGRGALRIIAGVALRATALYFRYGGLASSVFGFARGGAALLSGANSFRWSGLATRFGSFDLAALAGNHATSILSGRIYSFGSLGTIRGIANSARGIEIVRPSMMGRLMPSRAEVQESVLDRLDPTRYADRLASYLLRRKRIAELRGSHMYFYTDIPKPIDRRGLVGVNVHTGRDSRMAVVPDPDPQFLTDESAGLLYSADGRNLRAFLIR